MRLARSYGCPVEFALDVIGGKWKSLVLARLKDAPLRYGELRRQIPGLSDKMLTQRLHELVEADLLETLTDADGARLYALSARGETLRPVLQSLYDWGCRSAETFGVDVHDAR